VGAKENMLTFGVQSLVALSAPVFGSSSGRTCSDYFLEAGEYLGKGFVQASNEAKNESKQKQLELFKES